MKVNTKSDKNYKIHANSQVNEYAHQQNYRQNSNM